MIKFEVGKRYYCTSVCDHNARWEYTVTQRTDKSIWLDGKRFSLKQYEGIEFVYPLGKYSMCPILKSERLVA